MRKSTFNIILFPLIGIFVFSGIASAYWIWTPETKKFINPKYAVKDSPKEQYEWAMSFYDAKDFQRAAMEFEKLAKQYEFSEYASKAQYYVGLSYENMQKFYFAFQNYQKALDNFPHIANMDEILAREFAIGNIYLGKPSPKVLGTDIMAPLDRAVEIFKKVVENAPYGKYAEDAQFKLGEALKKSERYEEAVQAYHKLVDDYPNSKLATKAMYEEAYCAYKASLKPAYDIAATDNAIKTFEKFVDKNKDSDLAKEADTTMKRLKDNVAEKSFKTAEFYESQGKFEAAIIYYQDVVDTYPESSFVDQAKAKIDALKARGNKKVSTSPFSFDSKKPASKKKTDAAVRSASKKKSWNLKNKVWKPLSFIARKEETKKAPEAPVVEAPAQVVETSHKPDIKLREVPRSETPKAEPETQTVEAPKKEDIAPIAQEAPKKKTWKPFSFDSKKKPVVKKSPKKEWKPLSFIARKEETKKAPEAPVVEAPAQVVETSHKPDIKLREVPRSETPKAEPETQTVEAPKKEDIAPIAQEAPKKKTWKPFSFDSKKKPVVKETSKKEWKPLNFGTNDEPMGSETPKKEWNPLNFDKK